MRELAVREEYSVALAPAARLLVHCEWQKSPWRGSGGDHL